LKIFAWRPDRTGFTYWFPRLSLGGIGLGLLCWLAIREPGGETSITLEYGIPAVTFAALVVAMGITSGALLGLLNRWVASRSAAAIVGMVVVLPTSVAIGYFKLQAAGKLSVWNLALSSFFLAAVVGGLMGAIWYSHPADE
jgi:hypothetical protein